MKLKSLVVMAMMLMSSVVVRAQMDFPDADSKYATELLKPGTKAPDFHLKTAEDKNFRLSSLKGKIVVLDFWASWCPDCRKDAPNVVRMYREFKDKGVAFVGVSFDTDKANWTKAIAKYGMEYTAVSELKKWHDTKISKDYGVKWIPAMYIIGKDGNVVLGSVLSDKVEKTLTEMTAEKKTIPGTSERVTIEGAMGKLAAIIQKPVLSAGEKCPMVMILHGFMGNKGGQLNELIADSLQAHGIASVRFDFNGHGESEGDFSKMTVLNEIEDAKKVYDYVATLPYVDAVAVSGHSQGGVVASMLAGELGSKKIRAVALMAPAGVIREDAIRGSAFGKSCNPLDPPESVELFEGKKLGRDYIVTAFSLPIYETAAPYDGPAFIVHGTGDRLVPYTYGERFHKLWKNSEYVLLDGFDHGFTQNLYRADALVSDFLIKTLCK